MFGGAGKSREVAPVRVAKPEPQKKKAAPKVKPTPARPALRAEDVLNTGRKIQAPVATIENPSASRIARESVRVSTGNTPGLPPLPPKRPEKLSVPKSYTRKLKADIPRMPALPAGKVVAEQLARPVDVPPAAPREAEPVLLVFESGQSALSNPHKNDLKSVALPAMQGNDTLRLLIAAFAEPADETPASARRISLSRALSVRTYLMDHGIDSGRIDVRANGDKTDKSPIDRVDLVFLDPEG
jgi:outer membrane protein OmpA-like peptidoglycan-associated protein